MDTAEDKAKRILNSVVNFIGCSRVPSAIESKYASSYDAASVHNFTSSEGEVTGWTKSVGKGAGNLAFVSFHNAGHMVPHDDPVAALDMVKRWLHNKPLA